MDDWRRLARFAAGVGSLMGALGQRVPAHIRALDKTLIGDDCWEYGGKIRTDGYGSVFVHNGTRGGGTALAHRVVYEGMVGPIPEGKILCPPLRQPQVCATGSHLRGNRRGQHGGHAGEGATRSRRHPPVIEDHTLPAGAPVLRPQPLHPQLWPEDVPRLQQRAAQPQPFRRLTTHRY